MGADTEDTASDGSMDDIDPADVVSEELLVLLHQQNQLIEELLEQQQEVTEYQQELYDALTSDDAPPEPPEPPDPDPDPEDEDLTPVAPTWGFY